MRASFNQVEVALHIFFHSLFHIPVNNLYSIHSCLLCKNPGSESRVTKSPNDTYRDTDYTDLNDTTTVKHVYLSRGQDNATADVTSSLTRSPKK